jgi:NAD(P)-dependent dehydrogenase (short-subunit alcohol dehydrogenase family)
MSQPSGDYLLRDKVAIITGAGGDIGRAIAVRYAQEGARVAVAELKAELAEQTAAAVRDAGGEALVLVTDVSKRSDTEAMARRTVERWGRIDVLVNCAAIFGTIRRVPFYELTEEEWDAVMAVNLRGMWLCCKAVFPYMRDQGGGRIINIASGTAFWGSPQFLHYVTSKAGVIGLTRALAREVGQYGINVNAVAPGLTVTSGSLATTTREYMERRAQEGAFKRPEVPADLVGTFVYLASADSAFVTGQTIVVDGGRVFW